MQILFNTDNNIRPSEGLTADVEAAVKGALARFGDRITRVEVHLTDENSGHKSGDNDKRCAIEARLAGLPPIAVTEQGASVEQALSGAVETLEQLLDRKLGRLDDPKGRTSFAGEQGG